MFEHIITKTACLDQKISAIIVPVLTGILALVHQSVCLVLKGHERHWKVKYTDLISAS